MGLKELIFGGAVKGLNTAGPEFEGSTQEWLPIKNIIGGIAVTKDRRFVKVIEVMPVNFHLKTPHEQQTIIYYFASYLKIAPNELQIRVVTQRLDLEGYIAQMRKYLEVEEDGQCRGMIEDNIEEVSFVAANDVTTHRFFIIFQYEPHMKARGNTVRAIANRLNEEADTTRRYLDLCGLEALEPDYADNAVLELLYETINKNTARRVKLPDGVFDMVTDVHGLYGCPQ
jgi:NADH:ubiquinone oxidoreductase subunit C